MRNRYKRNSYYPKVAEAIGKNYLKLRSLCCVEFDTFHGSLSREDIFQDTVLYVIQDVEASLLESEEDIKDDGNYYTIIPQKASTPVNNKHKITKQLSKKTLAKRYLKEKGIKDEVKTNLLIETLKKAESC